MKVNWITAGIALAVGTAMLSATPADAQWRGHRGGGHSYSGSRGMSRGYANRGMTNRNWSRGTNFRNRNWNRGYAFNRGGRGYFYGYPGYYSYPWYGYAYPDYSYYDDPYYDDGYYDDPYYGDYYDDYPY